MRDHYKDFERLDGVDAQFITHVHDVDCEVDEAPDTPNEIHDRFGAKLHYHKAARSKVQAFSKCPEEVFGNDGLQLGSDFNAIYFPGHTPGHSIYRWRVRGKNFLFTGHVVNLIDGKWNVFLRNAPKSLRSQFIEIADADYALPTRSFYGREEFHSFTITPERASQKRWRQ